MEKTNLTKEESFQAINKAANVVVGLLEKYPDDVVKNIIIKALKEKGSNVRESTIDLLISIAKLKKE